MTSTLNSTMITHNQNPQTKPGLSRNDQKLIRAAVSQVTKAMKGKPAPEDFWYDLTRDGAELRNMHLDALVVRSRQALDAAKQQGVGVQAATLHRVEIMFATLCALAVHGYEVSGPESLPTALVKLSEEIGDVVVAAARAQHDPSNRNLEYLRSETLELIDIGEYVTDGASMQLCEAGR